MRFSLTPKETSFYDMFAAAAENLVVGSKLLLELLGSDVSARAEIVERMRAAEHAGDDTTHAIFHQLNSSFITPFDREDIYSLASSLDDSERMVFKTALCLAMACVLLQGVAGAGAARVVARYEPAKAAAAAAYWQSGTQPDLVLFAWPRAGHNHAAWVWRHAGGRLLGQDEKGRLLGLDHFSGMSPPVAAVFWSFRLMLLVGLLMLLASWGTYLRVRKRQFDPSTLSERWRRFLRLMMLSGWVGSLAGLATSLFGLSPFAVNGAVTLSEIAGTTGPDMLAGALVAYALFYAVLMLGFLHMLRHIARYGVVPVARTRGRA